MPGGACVLLAPMVSSCSEWAAPTEPPSFALSGARDASSDPVYQFLLEQGVYGEPVDFDRELIIDWPDEPPLLEAPAQALIDAVGSRDGRVFVGFREPESPGLGETAFGSVGARRARITPVSASTHHHDDIAQLSPYECISMIPSSADCEDFDNSRRSHRSAAHGRPEEPRIPRRT